LNQELSDADQEKNFQTLNIVRNEIIGQSDSFKQKLVMKHGIVKILHPFIENYKKHN
jgi:hypothetical protein